MIAKTKLMFMSTVEIRNELHRLIDQIDERFLKAIHSMVSVYQAEEPIGYDVDGAPIYGSELAEKLDKEVEEAKKGNYITIEELEKRSEKWITPTK